jgi:hypothetical protein
LLERSSLLVCSFYQSPIKSSRFPQNKIKLLLSWSRSWTCSSPAWLKRKTSVAGHPADTFGTTDRTGQSLYTLCKLVQYAEETNLFVSSLCYCTSPADCHGYGGAAADRAQPPRHQRPQPPRSPSRHRYSACPSVPSFLEQEPTRTDIGRDRLTVAFR